MKQPKKQRPLPYEEDPPRQDSLMPLLNLKNTPILSTRPVSSYTRASTTATQSKAFLPKQSKALYSLHDQFEDLRHKELQLEKAKLDFYVKAEETHYRNDLERAKADFQKQVESLNSQHLQAKRQQEQDHQQALQRILHQSSSDLERLKKEHSLEIEVYLTQLRSMEETCRHRLLEGQQRASHEVNQLKMEHEQQMMAQKMEITEKEKDLFRQKFTQEKKRLKQQLREERDKQVREICEKASEEAFREVQSMKERLRESEREKDKLNRVIQELQEVIARQEAPTEKALEQKQVCEIAIQTNNETPLHYQTEKVQVSNRSLEVQTDMSIDQIGQLQDNLATITKQSSSLLQENSDLTKQIEEMAQKSSKIINVYKEREQQLQANINTLNQRYDLVKKYLVRLAEPSGNNDQLLI
ncbi:hypothetical protein FGO68_gene160 [Halteria grandinella]|uniref:Uncharacterized protein n=1 Tax=Halteria grandinella TaxID=5974 RepID=A0A8J8P0D7_HALGN|nr:hypothetical protein FGO68_gene160 [Halteria grandinella]